MSNKTNEYSFSIDNSLENINVIPKSQITQNINYKNNENNNNKNKSKESNNLPKSTEKDKKNKKRDLIDYYYLFP
jgi:hypothetical protein